MSRDILTPEPYKFDEDFERTVIALCVRSAKFWMKVGYELEPDLLASESARTALRAARMVSTTASKPPSLARVRQRLATQSDDGRLSVEKLEKVLKYIDFAPTTQDFEDAVAKELSPLLKRRYSQQVAITSAGEYATGVAFEETKKLIAKLEAVGEEPIEDDDGMSFDSPDFEERMKTISLGDKMPCGVPDVDTSMKGGGFGRGCTILYIGSTGDGKTRALIHTACTFLRLGKSIAFATLEWSVEEVMAGITANLAGCSFDDAIKDPAKWRDVVIRSGVCRGKFLVKGFRPGRTTLEQIISWYEQKLPGAEAIMIDYLDKLNSELFQREKNMASYKEGMDISETFRLYCRARDIWGWSASQAQRRKTGGAKILGTDDVGLSVGKVQTGDYVITLNLDPDTQMLTYGIKKVRWGRGNYNVGPVPHDWDKCRMCMIGDDVDVDVEEYDDN